MVRIKKSCMQKFPHINDNLGYIDSRKQVYVPEYYELIKDNSVLIDLKNRLNSGESFTVYDFDGIRDNNGNPTSAEVNLELLQDKILDTRTPFGHGYLVAAAMLLDINPELYL